MATSSTRENETTEGEVQGMASKALGNNPLLNKKPQEKIFSAEEEAAIIAEQQKNNVSNDWTTATFKVRKDNMKKLRDYAYTERIEIKEALDQALTAFLKNKKDLLEAPEKPVTTRKKRK